MKNKPNSGKKQWMTPEVKVLDIKKTAGATFTGSDGGASMMSNTQTIS